MRLLVAGASGRTGRILVARAHARGHVVSALVRDPSSFPEAGARLRVFRGDVLSPETLAAAVVGQDAVISLLAPRPRINGRVYIEGTRNLADAAARAGVRRFIAVSAEGAGTDAATLPWTYRLVMRIPVVARLYPDIAAMEAELRSRTDLDWTVVRPPVLTNGPETGSYKAVVGRVAPGRAWLSRRDLAAFVLDVAECGSYASQSVAVVR